MIAPFALYALSVLAIIALAGAHEKALMAIRQEIRVQVAWRRFERRRRRAHKNRGWTE